MRPGVVIHEHRSRGEWVGVKMRDNSRLQDLPDVGSSVKLPRMVTRSSLQSCENAPPDHDGASAVAVRVGRAPCLHAG
ncbi:hypothetical protein BaRGS_00030821 [Batillaria attramentaria]|uniref:Uncharacterized protein n=1 Tax=Batillaria attramentaria TaxID=370345 RepID=A0ABD0JSR5_9CAEN